MKKLLSLFAISSITLTVAGSSTACSRTKVIATNKSIPIITINKLKPIAPPKMNPDRETYISYKLIPTSPGDWTLGKNFNVDLTKAIGTTPDAKTLIGMYLETNDTIQISFLPVSGTPTKYNNDSIKLGTAWKPSAGQSNFKITFNKFNFAVENCNQNTAEIDIMVIA